VGHIKPLYYRFIRWSEMGVSDQVFTALVAENGPPDRLMIDATHLKARRLLKGGMFPALPAAQRAG